MHTCQRCGKQLVSPQSLWNHKQRCERYDPPDDLHNEKRKAVAMYDSCERQRTKEDIVGYCDDDGDVQPSSEPSTSQVISKISVLPSGIVKDKLDSTTSKGKGLWLSRGRGIDEDDDDKVGKTTEKSKKRKKAVADKCCGKSKRRLNC